MVRRRECAVSGRCFATPREARLFAIFFKSSRLPRFTICDDTRAVRSRRCALPTEIWKTTPCKVAGSRRHDAFEAAKVFDTSGKSAALLYHHAIRKTPMALPDMGLPNMALPDDGRCGAMTRKTPYRRLKLHRLAAASDRLLVAEPRAPLARVRRENIDMNTAPGFKAPTKRPASGSPQPGIGVARLPQFAELGLLAAIRSPTPPKTPQARPESKKARDEAGLFADGNSSVSTSPVKRPAQHAAHDAADKGGSGGAAITARSGSAAATATAALAHGSSRRSRTARGLFLGTFAGGRGRGRDDFRQQSF